MTDNQMKFREVYERKLREAMAKHPEEFHYGPEGVPTVVDKMVRGFAKGDAMISSTCKATCRELKIKSTYAALKAYLADDVPA